MVVAVGEGVDGAQCQHLRRRLAEEPTDLRAPRDGLGFGIGRELPGLGGLVEFECAKEDAVIGQRDRRHLVPPAHLCPIAFDLDEALQVLDTGGQYQWRDDGEYHLFYQYNPHGDR